MIFRSHKPGPPLAHLVDLIWCYEGYASDHKLERILPSGEMEIVINLSQDETRLYDRNDLTRVRTQRGAILMGTQTEHLVIDTAETANTIGVHFKPGCAFAFCPLPADELQGLHVTLEELWGAGGALVRDRVLAASTVEAKFKVLESVLLEQAKKMERHPAVEFAVRVLSSASPELASPAMYLTDVVRRVGYSQRHFNALFESEVGLSPKKFSRVQRFQQVVWSVHQKNEVNWVDLALGCGYYDQAHFIHDFKAFSGMTPTEYMGLKTEHVNHVRVAGD
ncbi:MAG: helix-turn-helix transcriptional regulator [Acidobacteriaceae bacterium]